MTTPETFDSSVGQDLDARVAEIKREIKAEYRQPHSKPWIIGFSGGKDSTLVLHLVIESLLEIPWSERNRPVYIVANDTLVESPIVQGFVDETLEKLTTALADLQLPCTVKKTVPRVSHTYWVNVIGRGYPSPTRMFRWCTDRLKIRPTTDFIRQKVSESGEVILLLGVRRSESAARAATAKRYDNGERLNSHNDIPGCLVFRPILELDTEDVWEYLMTRQPPWAGTHNALVKLYRDAMGGECPIVIDPDAQPSCGSSSIRFGCWTCTVVDKDKSFRNQVDKGFEHLIPMAEFRDWMKVFCYTPENRMQERRNGQQGIGPLTFEARKIVLERLLELQKTVGLPLISDEELREIQKIWEDDKSTGVMRRADRLIIMLEER
ncbi:DNA sulfur modification protein DndC [Paraburkholderia caballeronis]|uniref:DNA phosphorothioation system sulfurtransferase DndC n=1 Tax=Paraburkholderia caballeronis TaxID=416943 RepID=UPI001064F9B6|nr:DNA phosphorothioation system sulfurtransferase DndC [Paraburkholderia caballeronis]TDV37461.1 DNA sulfur modification protein DndC [Paraburkholderia caballeronis]